MKLLGRGGMGAIYEAVHEPLARRVALKTILPDEADDASLARFRREAETAASLGHPNIVQVTDFQAPPGEPPFLVMELLEGRPLSEVIEAEGKLDPRRAAFIALQILSGLAAAHRAGIVHRDVKPGNVFLLSTLALRDVVKIVDFGIAKLVVDVAQKSRRNITDFGQVLGTFAYMAPEQARGGIVDARADLYAVGATLFHMLSGVRPTEAIVLGGGRPSLAHVTPWLDKRLVDVVDRALEAQPDARWFSAEEMADALGPFAGVAPAHVDEAMPPSRTIPDAARAFGVDARFSLETAAKSVGIGVENEPIPPTVAFGGTQPLAPPMRISVPEVTAPLAVRSSPALNAPPTPRSGSFPPPGRSSIPTSSPGSRTLSPGSTAWMPWVVGAVVFVAILVAVAVAVFGKGAPPLR